MNKAWTGALLAGLVFALVIQVQAQEQRKRPGEKAKEKKPLFWFRVPENSTELCQNVDEATLEQTVVEGAPAESCVVRIF